MELPSPSQVGQVATVTDWPKKERETCCTWPTPPQVEQVSGTAWSRPRSTAGVAALLAGQIDLLFHSLGHLFKREFNGYLEVAPLRRA